jgi:hypothetical protein
MVAGYQHMSPVLHRRSYVDTLCVDVFYPGLGIQIGCGKRVRLIYTITVNIIECCLTKPLSLVLLTSKKTASNHTDLLQGNCISADVKINSG